MVIIKAALGKLFNLKERKAQDRHSGKFQIEGWARCWEGGMARAGSGIICLGPVTELPAPSPPYIVRAGSVSCSVCARCERAECVY